MKDKHHEEYSKGSSNPPAQIAINNRDSVVNQSGGNLTTIRKSAFGISVTLLCLLGAAGLGLRLGFPGGELNLKQTTTEKTK
jgi:hypothetical protein